MVVRAERLAGFGPAPERGAKDFERWTSLRTTIERTLQRDDVTRFDIARPHDFALAPSAQKLERLKAAKVKLPAPTPPRLRHVHSYIPPVRDEETMLFPRMLAAHDRPRLFAPSPHLLCVASKSHTGPATRLPS